jgi:hypothetical protein
MAAKPERWPDGKAFAFSILDDTDRSTLSNVSPVYAFLHDHGFLTTKSVWTTKGREGWGDTCENPEYRAWCRDLLAKGFEIAFHNAAPHTSLRDGTRAGLQKFYEHFGHFPRVMANHENCRENIYWGDGRVTGLNRVAYNLLTRGTHYNRFRGHVGGDVHFWGDLCREHVTYVRNFVFGNINTLSDCPHMPYHDPERPYVNFWFASSEAPDLRAFTSLLEEKNQDRLEAEGGACILYTHLADGFCKDGRLDARFTRLMERLAARPGWFVPVSTLLDRLRRENGGHRISSQERRRLEVKWLLHKCRVGSR